MLPEVNAMTDDRWYTTAEAARLLKVTRYTIRKWLRSGTLKGRKVGRGWLIAKTSVLPPEPEP